MSNIYAMGGGGFNPFVGGGGGGGNPFAAYQQGSPGRGFVPAFHPNFTWNGAGQMQQIPPWAMQAMQGGGGGPMAPGMFNRMQGGLSGITPYGGAGGGPMMAPGMMTTPQGGTMNAPALYQQYQGMAPGAARDNLVRQMQGGDSGAAYNQAMRQAGYALNAGQGGQFSYTPPPMTMGFSAGSGGPGRLGGFGGGMPQGPMPGTAPPGSLSAAIQAMGRGSPYASDMMRQVAGLPSQIGMASSQGNPSSYGLDAMRNFQSQQNAGSVTGGQPTGTQYGLDAMRNFQNQQNAGFTGGRNPYAYGGT